MAGVEVSYFACPLRLARRAGPFCPLFSASASTATSSVSGETDYLVVGKNPGSKLDEAKKEEAKIIEEKEFEKLVKE